MKLFYQYMAIFFNFSTTSYHFHPLQVENCDSNSRLVVHEDDNGKFRLERVKQIYNDFEGGKTHRSTFRDDQHNCVESHRAIRLTFHKKRKTNEYFRYIILYCHKTWMSALRRFLYNPGNIVTEESPKSGLRPTLIERFKRSFIFRNLMYVSETISANCERHFGV